MYIKNDPHFPKDPKMELYTSTFLLLIILVITEDILLYSSLSSGLVWIYISISIFTSTSYLQYFVPTTIFLLGLPIICFMFERWPMMLCINTQRNLYNGKFYNALLSLHFLLGHCITWKFWSFVSCNHFPPSDFQS